MYASYMRYNTLEVTLRFVHAKLRDAGYHRRCHVITILDNWSKILKILSPEIGWSGKPPH